MTYPSSDYLQRDGRATTVELSEAAGLSPSPFHRRQKMLEESGVITGYVALLDQDRVGLPINVMVSVELIGQTQEHLEAFEAGVSDLPEVMECTLLTGSSDYLLRVVASGFGRLRGVLAHAADAPARRARRALGLRPEASDLPHQPPAKTSQ